MVFRRNYLNYGSIYFQRGYYDQAEASFRRRCATILRARKLSTDWEVSI